MGLFSKKTDAPQAPPMPPAPDATMAMPPAPNMDTQAPAPSMDMPDLGMPSSPGMEAQAPAPVQEESDLSGIPDGSNLTPPSLPGSGLDDIKSQVVGDMELELPSISQKQEIDNEAFSAPSMSTDDDLFNMFKVEDSEISHKEEMPTKHEHTSASEVPSFMPEPTDTHLSNDVALNFETKKISNANETIFLTTTQFKALLEVVDSVKSKIKSSTETHLRLMDMKAEEDVEYETLRKNFQFIEDKLHNLDEILFDN
ncbi:MAG: hypothetical protein HRU03_06145 [Nanoarchaeales archaeon]|nr:hypothetical protein [Nanoarchaeales archaeon]